MYSKSIILTQCVLAMISLVHSYWTLKLTQATISEAKAQSEIAFEAVALFATTLSVKGHLKAKFDGIESGLRSVVNAAVELPTSVSICDCYLDVDHCRFVPWQNTVQGQTHQQLVPNGPLFISTTQTVVSL